MKALNTPQDARSCWMAPAATWCACLHASARALREEKGVPDPQCSNLPPTRSALAVAPHTGHDAA